MAMARECERTVQEMEGHFRQIPGVFFRFSVEQGTQTIGPSDWEKTPEAVTHARAYLRLVENFLAEIRATLLMQQMPRNASSRLPHAHFAFSFSLIFFISFIMLILQWLPVDLLKSEVAN
jgi:hypothetical protein